MTYTTSNEAFKDSMLLRAAANLIADYDGTAEIKEDLDRRADIALIESIYLWKEEA